MENELTRVSVIEGDLKSEVLSSQDTISNQEKENLNAKSQEESAQVILDVLSNRGSTDGSFLLNKYGGGIVSQGVQEQAGMTGEDILLNFAR